METIVYLYDSTGAPIGFRYRTPDYAEEVWDDYYYEKNMQGDIVRVYNSEGVKLVSYVYTAWGEITSTTYHNSGANTTVTNNPFTYRGYYYDRDLGLYYLQSRYYDSKVCRFISPDTYISTGQGIIGYNMYSYCENNPVIRADYTGRLWRIVLIMAIAVVTIVALTSCDTNYDEVPNKSAEEIYDNNTTIFTPSDFNDPDQSIAVSINLNDIHGLSRDNEKIKEYTNTLADGIENEYSEIFESNEINRVQLYSEIKLHLVCWDLGILTKHANPADVNIYSNGDVKDKREFVNKLAFWLYGGEYNE